MKIETYYYHYLGAYKNPLSFYILYIKAIVVVSVYVGSACKILPVIARSLWSFFRCNFLKCN